MSSSDHSARSSSSSSRWSTVADEHRWVIQIRQTLDEEHDDQEVEGVPVSIFNVPKPLLETKPEGYSPQLIALGPYHHWKPELLEMEQYKLSAAKRIHKQLRAGAKFQDLVDNIAKHERHIRAHYHRFLNFSGETLAWMMAVDACFLVEFLHVYAVDESYGRTFTRKVSSRMSHLVDVAGRKSAHNIILRDIMMLENQIPLFLVRKILDLRSREAADDRTGEEVLKKMLTGFMKELSPFKMLDNFPPLEVSKNSHLLDILYKVLVPNWDQLGDEVEMGGEEAHEGGEEAASEEGSLKGLRGDSGTVKQLCGVVGSNFKAAAPAVGKFMKKVATSKPVRVVFAAPWKLLHSLPGVSALVKPMEAMLGNLAGKGDGDGTAAGDGEQGGGQGAMKKPPRVEEIAIPSVEELISSGVRFVPTHGDLTTISFDFATATFSLPVVSLDVNTEAVLRNLVAYESSAASGPLVLTRYTELMNGIIDTEEDVKLLRTSGVLLNHMKSDAKVADLWNGMNRSVRLTKVGFMDAAIEETNRYYNGRWKVKAKKFMKKYVFGSWPFLTFVAAVLLLLLTALQAFCSVYTCSRWFNDIPALGQQG